MKTQFKLKLLLMTLILISTVYVAPLNAQHDQANYKHPYIDATGHVSDGQGKKLGWIAKDGIIYNAAGEKIAYIKGPELMDNGDKKLGRIDKNGTFYNNEGAIVFTVDPKSKGDKCQIFDPQGKVIATVHEGYKNQACAIHCLYHMKEMKP